MNTVNSHRRYFPRGPGLGLRTFVLAILSGFMIYADQHGTSLKPLREYATWSVSPLVWLASLPQGAVQVGAGVKTRDSLERENLALHDQQLLLQAKLQKLAALEAENRRIRELLSSSQMLQDRVLIAEIIAVSQDPYRHQITLNKGTSDRVYRGQALIDATGIMGQVVEVGPHTSQALLITDPDHGIPVEINRTGLQTIALGLGDGRGLKLPFLPSNADIKVGDLLVSSALGGRFPAGYPVGQIHNVKNLAGEHFMEAIAYPSAKLNQGRQALLVWSEHKTGTAPAPIAAVALPATAPESVPTPAALPIPAPAPAAVTPAVVATPKPSAVAPTPAPKPAPKPAVAAPAAKPAPKPAVTTPKPVVSAPKPAAAPAAKPATKPAAQAAPAAASKPAAAPKPATDHATPAATPEPTPTTP